MSSNSCSSRKDRRALERETTKGKAKAKAKERASGKLSTKVLFIQKPKTNQTNSSPYPTPTTYSYPNQTPTYQHSSQTNHREQGPRERERSRGTTPSLITAVPIRSRRDLATLHQSKHHKTWIEEQEQNWVKGAEGGGYTKTNNKRKWRRGKHQTKNQNNWNIKRNILRKKFRTTNKCPPPPFTPPVPEE